MSRHAARKIERWLKVFYETRYKNRMVWNVSKRVVVGRILLASLIFVFLFIWLKFRDVF